VQVIEDHHNNHQGGAMKMSIKRKTLYGAVALLLFTCPCIPGNAADGPEMVELGSLTQYYEPVQFDHELHVGMIESNECAICHHHTLGTPVMDPVCQRCHASSGEADFVACRDCHPAKRFSAEYLAVLEEDINLFHLEKPGLQGAFHQNCLECHKEYGAPTGCQDCHVRLEEGDKFFYSGAYAPESADNSSGH
jgi:hypothetical protein